MSILTSVSDGLALLVSGAAMATAARALWLASPHRRTKPAASASTSAATSQPAADPAPAPPTAAPSRRRTAGNGGSTRGRGNQTREQVRAFLAERAGSDLSLVQVSQGVGRSSATISYTLDKLVQAGEVELTSAKPRRYTITPSGTAAHQQQPQQQEQGVQAEQVAPPEPIPAEDRKAKAEPQPRTRPRARKTAANHAEEPSATAAAESRRAPKPASTPRSANSAKARGGGLREEVRTVLASRAGEALSLGEVSGGLGRSSATVSYHLQGLVEAGEARLVDGKPRRYTIAATATPSVPSAPALVAAGEPVATATNASGAVAASGSTGRGSRGARAAGGRRSATGRSGKKAGAATGKVAAAGK